VAAAACRWLSFEYNIWAPREHVVCGVRSILQPAHLRVYAAQQLLTCSQAHVAAGLRVLKSVTNCATRCAAALAVYGLCPLIV
jgi:hypothetical protein